MNVPDYVKNIVKKLEKAGFEAYIIGGCVRDLLMGHEPQDWDVTTSARPEQILKVFPEGKYENVFGTVLVPVQISDFRFQISDLEIISKGVKINNKDKDKAIEIAKRYLSKIECPAHGMQHSKNVVDNVLKIAKDYEDINLDIIEIAAFFHDTGAAKYNDQRHIIESQNIVRKELGKIFNKNIVEIISGATIHSFSYPTESLEQHIIKEADKIDAINPERWKTVDKTVADNHFEKLKQKFNITYYNKNFLTNVGKKLLCENIKKFNEENFGFKLTEFEENREFVEVTTYRSEQGYSDRRHPDKIVFEDSLEKDLARRDFTINALAMKSTKSQIPRLRPDCYRGGQAIPKQITNYKLQITNYYIIDLFGGQKDLKKKIIRAVGEPVDRFKEDALRMIRAIRLACQLGFTIEDKTQRGIKKMAGGLKFIAKERIRDELIKILETDKAYDGIMLLHKTKLLQYIIPELERGVGVNQNRHHVYTVFKHSILSLKHCPSKDWRVKFASLLHDIAKPQTKKFIKGDATFYNHDIVGAKVAKKIMQRLKFSNKDMEKVFTLIRNHMFYYNVGEVTASSVRRLIRKVGEENLADLIDLRVADRLGSGVPKAKPYKLRHLEYMMERVRKDPVSVKKLNINGDDLMKLLKIKPGPKIGAILDVLLAEVIEDPKLNDKKHLEKRSKELNELDLKELQEKAKEKIEEKKMEDDKELKREFWVK